jgi:hypothetical protein
VEAVAPAPAPGLDRFAQQQLFKRLTDLSFMTQLGDEMIVRKIEYSGADKMTIPAYFFAPNDTVTKHPVVILVHGGVHGDLSDLYVPHIRSLVSDGYIVVAPEYRGSTGYGRAHYDAIDYGGKEVEDAVMTDPMLTGDERKPGGARRPADSTLVNITIDRDNVVTAPGFGLLRGAIVDQHFVRRRRQNRLMSLVLENPSLIGIGIDESTALVVRPDGAWEVIGTSVVLIFDARSSAITPAGSVLGASGLRVHVLPGGSTFDPVAGRVVRLGPAR